MKHFKTYLVLIFSLLIFSCEKKMSEQEVVRIGQLGNQKTPKYLLTTGLNLKRVALTSSEVNLPTLAVIQFPENPRDTSRKIWQHPSWIKMGPVGSITSDDDGNAYTAPVPRINTLNRSIEITNTILKVNSSNGTLETFMKLPLPDSVNGITPYGILGLYFDNHGKKLYASTVSGSTKDVEKGKIYVIDCEKKKIVDELDAGDTFGLFVAGITGTKRLYYGSARSPQIYSIELNKEGLFIGKPKEEFSLNQLGPRGNDKARRIRIDKFGSLYIYGLDFNYNLSARTIKPESIYKFDFNSENNKWIFVKIIK